MRRGSESPSQYHQDFRSKLSAFRSGREQVPYGGGLNVPELRPPEAIPSRRDPSPIVLTPELAERVNTVGGVLSDSQLLLDLVIPSFSELSQRERKRLSREMPDWLSLLERLIPTERMVITRIFHSAIRAGIKDLGSLRQAAGNGLLTKVWGIDLGSIRFISIAFAEMHPPDEPFLI